jgi:V/A-type H+-transporting ATPase subunit A
MPVRVPHDSRAVANRRTADTVSAHDIFSDRKGGAAAIPGGFGTGTSPRSTSSQNGRMPKSLCSLVAANVKRMTEGREFPELKDPRSGRPLMERTILIANTSNMPVAAREVSIYTGITLAEYYRDMGLNVAVFADSTSRWAEALRELAARLEEMPAEEGFPATLPTRLAQFYERGGAVTTLGGERGSVSIVGAVSPPGGDFSEPVTQHTRRFIRCFWARYRTANARLSLDSLAASYSEYTEDVSAWWKTIADWRNCAPKR